MNLKIFNYVSAVCFVLSSASLLFIPFLNFEENFPEFAYFLAGLFWIGLLAGMVLQMILWFGNSKREIRKDLKKSKRIVAVIFALSGVSSALILLFLKANAYALPISLFAVLISTEAFFVIKSMERIL